MSVLQKAALSHRGCAEVPCSRIELNEQQSPAHPLSSIGKAVCGVTKPLLDFGRARWPSPLPLGSPPHGELLPTMGNASKTRRAWFGTNMAHLRSSQAAWGKEKVWVSEGEHMGNLSLRVLRKMKVDEAARRANRWLAWCQYRGLLVLPRASGTSPCCYITFSSTLSRD